jgi:hypothetical protein
MNLNFKLDFYPAKFGWMPAKCVTYLFLLITSFTYLKLFYE